MCAPCKVIINQMFQDAAGLADLAREVSLSEYGGGAGEGEKDGFYLVSGESDQTSSDDELFQLASAEVAAILATRNQAINIALRKLRESAERGYDARSPASVEKWSSLLEKLR